MCKQSNATPTGFAALDTALNGGLRPGLTLIAGRPGMGKTTFMGQIAGRCGGSVWFKGEVTPESIRGVANAAAADGSVLFLDRDNVPPAMDGAALAGLARKLRIPVVASTGISRFASEGREDDHPQLMDLWRERPDLVDAADVVIALYRNRYYNVARWDDDGGELLILKNALSGAGIIPVTFDPRKRVWEEITDSPENADNAAEQENALPPREQTFETLVIHGGNKEACSAAMIIADGAEKVKGDLFFFYGESGTGKTHLLSAIYHRFTESHHAKKAVYARVEVLKDKLIRSFLVKEAADPFERFASQDLLLIDDFQMIQGLETTTKEVMRLVERCRERGQIVVIAGNTSPDDLKLPLHDRSRLFAGISIALKLPEKEAKFEVVNSIADREGVALKGKKCRNLADHCITPWQMLGKVREAACKELELELVDKMKKDDILLLISDEYVSFFSDPAPDCRGETTGSLGSWNYPAIMGSFREAVMDAYTHICRFGREDDKPVWALMREKYFDGEDYVQPEDMILHIDSFDVSEFVAFLHYCAWYKERFCDGAFGDYTKEGLIGKCLLKLKHVWEEV